MNNFSNFETNNVNAPGRPAPGQPQPQSQAAPPQPQPQYSSGGLNGPQQWPNVGAQSDMNVLWEYVVKLSEMHEQIRAQTQQVAGGMQQIESLRARDGLPPAPHESAELASLRASLSASQSHTETLNQRISQLSALNSDFESALSTLLEKIRPFSSAHASALVAQKAHYLSLLEAERGENLALRLEQSRWQEGAQRAKEILLDALRRQGVAQRSLLRKLHALRCDNRALRRICGVPLREESEESEGSESDCDDEEDDEEHVHEHEHEHEQEEKEKAKPDLVSEQMDRPAAGKPWTLPSAPGVGAGAGAAAEAGVGVGPGVGITAVELAARGLGGKEC